jgi:hypothetical protein
VASGQIPRAKAAQGLGIRCGSTVSLRLQVGSAGLRFDCYMTWTRTVLGGRPYAT